jgi:methionyl aminopeptidase
MQATAANSKPANKYCKDDSSLEGMRRAGAFNGELLDYVRPFITCGVSTEEINRLVHEYTINHGHTPATLGYHGFPKSCCTSRNEVVCHGIPSSKDIVKEGDIINVDLTTIVDGFYGDSSETFLIGAVSAEARHLVRVAAQALIRGINAVVPGRPLSDIAEAIEPFVVEQGCTVVKQYTGHGIGRKFHEHFSVYHHRESGNEHIIMEPGMTFTIEPMVNQGGFQVVTDAVDRWTVRTRDKTLSAQFEHTVAVTQSGVEILTLTPRQRAAEVPLLIEGIEI